jgi:hypothetical protein
MGKVSSMQCACRAELVVWNDDDVVCVECGTFSPRWVDPRTAAVDSIPVRPKFSVRMVEDAAMLCGFVGGGEPWVSPM